MLMLLVIIMVYILHRLVIIQMVLIMLLIILKITCKPNNMHNLNFDGTGNIQHTYFHTSAAEQVHMSSRAGTTGQTGSSRPIRPVPAGSATGGHLEERHDIIHIKVPRLSSIFDKLRFSSNLPNSRSDHMISVD